MEFELFNVLGKDINSSEVRDAIQKHDLTNIEKFPPNNIYQSSEKRGLSLLIENKRVSAVQIYVRPMKKFAAFSDPLPFGIKKGMTQQEVHHAVGEPTESSEISSRYEMPEISAKVIVRYNQEMIVDFPTFGGARKEHIIVFQGVRHAQSEV